MKAQLLRKRTCVVLVMLLAACAAAAPGVQGDVPGPKGLKRWAYPGAITCATGEGECGRVSGHAIQSETTSAYTADPFDKVVRFYAEKSGFDVSTNREFIDRKFPGHRPETASWEHWQDNKGISAHHNIGQSSACVSLLLTDLNTSETVNILISRGLADQHTFIALTRVGPG